MSAPGSSTPTRGSRVRARVRGFRDSPLATSASSLLLTTGLTSAVGFLFWIVAARNYTTESLGRASAQISAVSLVGSLAALNIGPVLMRLLPTAGVRARWLVVRSYAVTVVLALIGATAVVASGIGSSFMPQAPWARVAFIVVTALALVFVLQDSVLVGLRRSTVLLVENGVFATVKLVLLIAVASLLPAAGIQLAWYAPLAVAVVVVNVYIFRVVLPRHHDAAEGRSHVPPRLRLASFVSAEYSRSLLSALTTWLLPILVTTELGPAEAAYFYLPWIINYSAQALPNQISSALVVESMYEGEMRKSALRSSVRYGMLLVGSIMLVEFFVVPVFLHLAGPEYAEEGTPLIRLFALALPFNAINGLYGTFAWMEQRLWLLVGLRAVMTTLLLGGTLLFIDRGLTVVAVCYLFAHVVLAVCSLPPLIRRFRADRITVPGREAPSSSEG